MSFPRCVLLLALGLLFALTPPITLSAQGSAPATPLPRPEEVKQLLATLQSTAASHHDKVVACHRLAVLGPREAVPALAALLSDERLAHMARHALEPMTDPAAGDALREALGRLQGPLQIGVINSLGFRRDPLATPVLGQLLASPSVDAAAAAAAALGRIGTADAARLLQDALARASGPLKFAFADSSLACAEALVLAGQRRAAAAIYDLLCGSDYPSHVRTAAMRGAITSRERAGLPLLVQQLKGDDRALLAAAWRAARELPGPEVTKALAAEFPRLPEDKQVLLLQVFGDRADSAALPAALDAASRGSPPVRLAALQTLPRLDDGRSALPVLLQAVAAGRTPEETSAALASLGSLESKEADARLLATLPNTAPALRARLIGVLAARRSDRARPELLRLAHGSEPEVAKAALRALAVVGQPDDLPALIRLSTTLHDDGLKVPADLAIYSVSMKIQPKARRADPVLDAVRAASDSATRTALLRPLGALVKAGNASHEIMDTVKTALGDADAAVRLAALRLLADWPDATPAPLLLDVARRGSDPALRELALRGGSRMAGNVAAGIDPTKLDALAWFTAANPLVQTDPEKLVIVSGLGQVKRIEALRLLQPYLDDPAVQTEAALAVIEIAPALAATPNAAQVRQALDKILATTKDADIRRKAGKAAKSLPAKSVPKKK